MFLLPVFRKTILQFNIESCIIKKQHKEEETLKSVLVKPSLFICFLSKYVNSEQSLFAMTVNFYLKKNVLKTNTRISVNVLKKFVHIWKENTLATTPSGINL